MREAAKTTVNLDVFQELLESQGMDKWRDPDWPESTALTSRVAAHQYRRLFDMLHRYVDSKGPLDILDWGSGAAVFSYVLALEGHRVCATDHAVPPMASFIEEETEGRFAFTRVSDPVVLSYHDASFDVVLSNACLEHVRETGGSDIGSLAEINRVTKPGGFFICTHLPNRYSWIEAYVRLFDRPDRFYHRYRYSRNEIYAKARTAGFDIVELSAYGAFPRNPLSNIPLRLRDSATFIKAVDLADDLLARIIGPICQNFAWVGRKPDENDDGTASSALLGHGHAV